MSRGSRRYLVPLRAAYLAVNRIPGVASLVHHLPIGRLRRHLRADIRARDVLELLDALATAGVHAWLVGGWGIDALVGTQTRDHEDVDICVETTAFDAARAALSALAFAVVEEGDAGHWLPDRFVLRDRIGRIVDLLPVDADRFGPLATGSVDTRPVACISVDAQLRLHADYEPRDIDRRDVATLCRHFRLELPTGYR